MAYAASHNQISDTAQAVAAAIQSVRSQLDGAKPDVAFVFVSIDHTAWEPLAQTIRTELGVRHLLGCSGETVIGTGSEVEAGPALSLWCAAWPDAVLHAFHVTFERTPDGLVASGLPSRDEVAFSPKAAFLLGDPFTCAADSVMEILGEEFAGLPVMGGMASGGRGPGSNSLYLDDERLETGGVAILLGEGVPIRSIVSQGCRPVGQRFLVTKAQKNVVFELGGRPALDMLGEVFSTLAPDEQQLLQRGPHLGIAMDEYKSDFGRGDFLIANVMGGDRSNGAIAIGNYVRVGQTVQFHVRDAETADEDLRSLLGQSLTENGGAEAALLFSCNGRGTRMFPAAHHDAGVIEELVGPVPLAGFFAQGELGPVAGKNHMHGFTASVVLFGGKS
jgi:small ligand-binding sensory domain FIST